MARALQGNGFAHLRHAYSHQETTIPQEGHTQAQPDSRRFKVTAKHISEVVVHAESHSLGSHISQPYTTVTVTQYPTPDRTTS